MPGELWWRSLRSDWSACDQPWPLIGHKGSHGPRTNWPWQSPFPGQERWQTQVLRSWANPDTLREGFLLSAQLPQNLYTTLTAEIILARYPILSRGVTKNLIFSWEEWELQCCCNPFYLLLHSSWSDAIWLKSIVCMHIYVILIYTREGLCIYKMHRNSLVRLDFQLKSGSLCIHILRSG